MIAKLTSKCRVCRGEYSKRSMTHRACSIECSLVLVAKEKQSKEAKTDKLRKEAIKSLSDLKREAQTEFNKFIRTRDAHLSCISCGRSTGCKVNAGHYLSVGSHPQLRYNEQNCHLQCEHCNTYKSGNQAAYRPELIKKIGLSAVEELEAMNDFTKFTRDGLLQIKAEYRAKTKELSAVKQNATQA